MVTIPTQFERILRTAPELRSAYVVGGAVRDALLGQDPKDIDVEVFGTTWDVLERTLSQFGPTHQVGKSFGVIKLRLETGHEVDFSLPRRDSKSGPGHRGFEVTVDPSMTLLEAASRRDYTINALAWDPRLNEVLDPFRGVQDLRSRTLRHTSAAFSEDPLRVLRGMQFAGRFNMYAAPETLAICREMLPAFSELPLERLQGEWWKWATKSTAPGAGLRFLVDCGWVAAHPEVAALVDCQQDPEWHPEGDVFVHTCHCCDAMTGLQDWQVADESDKAVLMFAILAHDFGKPATTARVVRDGRTRIVSPGHEPAGGPIADGFLARIGMPEHVRERVVPLVVHHLAHLQAHTERSVRRLATRLAPETIGRLCMVMTADHCGRPPHPKVAPPGVATLRGLAETMRVQDAAPKPVLLGRHILALGVAPGPQVGVLLAEAFEAQLDGQFVEVEDGLRWIAARAHLGVAGSAASESTQARAGTKSE